MYNPEPRFFNIVNEPIIGKNVSLVDTLIDGLDQVTIGDNTFFGHDCMILTGYHDKNVFGEDRQQSIRHKPITIGSGVWVASGAKILAGVTIGNNAVICAGAVVTKSVPEREMWGGVPARFIKKL